MCHHPKAPLCNRRPGTGPVLLGFTFPLCWRCSAAIFAIITIGTAVPVATLQGRSMLFLALLLLALGVWDGWRSYNTARGSTNLRRIFFGICLGAGLYVLVLVIALFFDISGEIL